MKGGIVIDPQVRSIDGRHGGYYASGGGEACANENCDKGNKVYVNVPSVTVETFEGTITSDPQTIEEEYRQIIKKIDELTEEQKT